MSHPEWFRPSLVPLTVVCGAPGAGKSTFVARRRAPTDRVICFDQIADATYPSGDGRRASASLRPDQVFDVLRRRNEMLADLMRAGTADRWNAAWLIVSEPSDSGRAFWRDRMGARVRVLLTPPDVCLRRIAEDAAAGDRRSVSAGDLVDQWWRTYRAGRPARGDERVEYAP